MCGFLVFCLVCESNAINFNCTTNTLLAGCVTFFYFVALTDYSEALYSGYDRKLADSKCDEFVDKITICLSLDNWDFYQNIEFNEENEHTIFVFLLIILTAYYGEPNTNSLNC